MLLISNLRPENCVVSPDDILRIYRNENIRSDRRNGQNRYLVRHYTNAGTFTIPESRLFISCMLWGARAHVWERWVELVLLSHPLQRLCFLHYRTLSTFSHTGRLFSFNWYWRLDKWMSGVMYPSKLKLGPRFLVTSLCHPASVFVAFNESRAMPYSLILLCGSRPGTRWYRFT